MFRHFFSGWSTRFLPRSVSGVWEIVDTENRGDETILENELQTDPEGVLNLKVGLPLEDEVEEEKVLELQPNESTESIELTRINLAEENLNEEPLIVEQPSAIITTHQNFVDLNERSFGTHCKNVLSNFVYKFGVSIFEFLLWRTAEYMITVSFCYFFPALTPFIRVIYIFSR